MLQRTTHAEADVPSTPPRSFEGLSALMTGHVCTNKKTENILLRGQGLGESRATSALTESGLCCTAPEARTTKRYPSNRQPNR
jgi:hypothetical protein